MREMTMRWLMVPAAALVLAGCGGEPAARTAEPVAEVAAASPAPLVDQSRYACEQLAATTHDARSNFDSERMLPLASSAAAGKDEAVAEAAVQVVAVFKVYGDPDPGEEALEVFDAMARWRLACSYAYPDIEATPPPE